MERHVSMEEISDGKFYGPNDMVRADCGGCQGCSACCRGMGQSVVLDPLDFHRLCTGLKAQPDQIMGSAVDLHVEKGIIFLSLKMSGPEESCLFLNQEGRCSIHGFRPGFCRMFPLGRFYEEEGGFRYFLQIHECPKEPKAKVKVKKWIDTPDFKQYEIFISQWHDFIKGLQKALENKAAQREEGNSAQEWAKSANLFLLQEFYLKPYGTGGFYEEFGQRMAKAHSRFNG